MITPEKAKHFAEGWIQAWNARDLKKILEHYSDEIIFTSPFVVQLTGKISGTLHGKEELRPYFEKALKNYPSLKFEMIRVLIGISSVVLYYRSVNNLIAAETMVLDGDLKISKVFAHYTTS